MAEHSEGCGVAVGAVLFEPIARNPAAGIASASNWAANEAVACDGRDMHFIWLDGAASATSQDFSVDYAIFGRASEAAVVPVSFEWSDLVTGAAVVWRGPNRVKSGNGASGPVHLSNANNCLVVSELDHVVVDVLDDVATIAPETTVFVDRQFEVQHIGAVAKLLNADLSTRALTETDRTYSRPWCRYSSAGGRGL